MNRIKDNLQIVAASLLAWSAIALLAPLQSSALAQTKSKASASSSLSESAPDEAFRQARTAMLKGDSATFERVSSAAAKHELATYIDYWRLRLRLSANTEPDLGALNEDVGRYINANKTSVAADLLRRDWMLALGKRGDWVRFEAVQSDWVLDDDRQAQCYGQLLSVKKQAVIDTSIREQLLTTAGFGDGCNALVAGMAGLGKLSKADVAARLYIAAETSALGAARKLAELHPAFSQPLFESALVRPSQVLAASATVGSDQGSKELLVFALVRLAVSDPEAAAQDMQVERKLSDADKAFVWAQIAASGAKKTREKSSVWAAKAMELKPKNTVPWSDDTLGWTARAALRAGDFKTLALAIDAMGSEAKKDPTWVYWRAKAIVANGGAREEADKLFRSIAGGLHFYGQLSGEEIGRLVMAPAAAQPPVMDEVVSAVVNGSAVKRALQFYDLGMYFEGNREWNFALRQLDDRQLAALAQWAQNKKIFHRTVSTADRTQSIHDFSLRYIMPFKAEVVAAAKKEGLDPAFVYGLIRQESRFLMDARSHVGASGLMQIMPATARWIAKRLGVQGFEPSQLSDIDLNTQFGTYYLKTVMDGLEGSPLLASAAYNAGPNRPRLWRSTLPAKIEGAAFAETIPFTETRDYVKKVLLNAAWYGSLLTGQPQSLKTRLGEVVPKVSVAADTP